MSYVLQTMSYFCYLCIVYFFNIFLIILLQQAPHLGNLLSNAEISRFQMILPCSLKKPQSRPYG